LWPVTMTAPATLCHTVLRENTKPWRDGEGGNPSFAVSHHVA